MWTLAWIYSQFDLVGLAILALSYGKPQQIEGKADFNSRWSMYTTNSHCLEVSMGCCIPIELLVAIALSRGFGESSGDCHSIISVVNYFIASPGLHPSSS